MTKTNLRLALLAGAAACVVCSVATPTVATGPAPKWCEGVKIAAFAGGYEPGSGDFYADKVTNGYRQAALDLGPTLTLYYSNWSPELLAADLGRAVESMVDGIAFFPHGPDAAVGAIIDKAFANGMIVTTTAVAAPDAQKTYASRGMGAVGAPNDESAARFAAEVAKRARLGAGDKVLLWGEKGLIRGVADGLEKSGVTIVPLEPDKSLSSGAVGPSMMAFMDVMSANPDIKVIVILHSYLTSNIESLAMGAKLKPGQVYVAGTGLSRGSLTALKDGYLNLVSDDQEYLQGYLPILNICLTKKFGFAGLDVRSAAIFLDATNVDAVAPLVGKLIR